MQGIAALYRFPTFDSREAYERITGKVCPPWNQFRQPKFWLDPQARTSASRRVVYPDALGTNPDTGAILRDANMQPFLDALVLDREEAGTVNIPPTGTGNTDVPGADQPAVPCPIRELANDEVIKFIPGSGGALVGVYTAAELEIVEVGFLQADRERLKRIAVAVKAEV